MGRRARANELFRRASGRWLDWYESVEDDVRRELDAELGALSPSCFDPAYPRTRSEDATWALLAAKRVDTIFADPARASRFRSARQPHLDALAHATLDECGELAEIAQALLARVERAEARWTHAERTWRALRKGWLSDEQLAGEIVTGDFDAPGAA